MDDHEKYGCKDWKSLKQFKLTLVRGDKVALAKVFLRDAQQVMETDPDDPESKIDLDRVSARRQLINRAIDLLD